VSVNVDDAIRTAEDLSRQVAALRDAVGPGSSSVALSCAVVSLRESVSRLRCLAAAYDGEKLKQ
jgi:hypothetical protein